MNALHEANTKLYGSHGYAYDSGKGTWTAPAAANTSPANTAASSASGPYNSASSASDAGWKQQAQANSAAWHEAKAKGDTDEMKRLHDANSALYSQHGYNYDAATGQWSHSAQTGTQAAQTGAQAAQTGTQAAQTGTQAAQTGTQAAQTGTQAGTQYSPYANVDLGEYFDALRKMNVLGENGYAFSADDMQEIVDARQQKALDTPGLEKYAYDGKYYEMQAYVDLMRRKETEIEEAQEEAEEEEERLGQFSPEEYYQDVFDAYYGEEAAARREAEIRAANEAAVRENVEALNAQKYNINLAGEQGNAAAEQAYMQAINPNGSLAENLAANGLLTSGLTESSQIAAGNAYQAALNENSRNVNEQLAEIERAISSAELSGDLATAEQLQSWYDTVANAAIENARDVVSANQWQRQLDYSRSQSELSNALSEAGVTGYYNGSPTLANQQYQSDLALNEAALTGKYNGGSTLYGQSAQDAHNESLLNQAAQGISNQAAQVNYQTALLNYQILLKYGMSDAEAQSEAVRLSNIGVDLSNQLAQEQITSQKLENAYDRYQLGSYGIPY